MIGGIDKLPLCCLKVAVKLSGRPTGVSAEVGQYIVNRGCIFIHIPKCAGSAVQKGLFGSYIFGHQTIRQYQVALRRGVYRDAWKFTVTRNPWERIVSAWRFLMSGVSGETRLSAKDAKFFAENLSQYPSFDHFVNDWLVEQNLGQCGCVHFKPQLHYLTAFDGSVPMDSMVKLTDLAGEYEKLRRRFDGGELIVDNATRGRPVDYRSFYTSEETFTNVS
jgi:chondroitin 4-sulfotransferase 11